MINTSNEYKEYLAADKRAWIEVAEVHFKDDPTILTLTNENFWNNGFTIEDAVSSDSNFEIGCAIVNKASFIINNLYGDYDDYDFTDAEISIKVNLALSSRTEILNKGTFIVNKATYYNGIISLECYDKMTLLDRLYSESQLQYPASLLTIVRNACSMCDVVFASQTFPHNDYIVESAPEKDSTTFREVVAWAAQIAGCFARFNNNGQLEFKWYDQEAISSVDTPSNRRHEITQFYGAPHVSLDPVIITGINIEVNVDNGIQTYSSGTNDYSLTISSNPFITTNTANQVLNWLAAQLIGFRFYQANFSHSSDPSIEAGDVAVLIDRNNNKFPVVISRTVFKYGAAQSSVSAAQTPARNIAARVGVETKNYVEVKKRLSNAETDMETMYNDLSHRIDDIDAGGLYSTKQTTSSGNIYYLHNKPTLAESNIVWKMNSEAWAVSTDGGTTWNAGMTVDGDVIARILSARGVNASWIDAGTLTVMKPDGTQTFVADMNSGSVSIVADYLRIMNNGTPQTVGQIARDAATMVVDNVKIGGVNMLRGTNTTIALSKNGLWEKDEWAKVDDSMYEPFQNVLVNDAPNNNIRRGWDAIPEEAPDGLGGIYFPVDYGLWQRKVPVYKGKPYVMSCYVKGKGTLWFKIGYDTVKSYKFNVNYKGWTQVYWKFNMDAAYITDSLTNVAFTAEVTSSHLYICGMKLEQSTTVTDWSEAPLYLYDYTVDMLKDYEATLTQEKLLEKLTNNFKNQGVYLNNGLLYINASYIKSGSLDANFIRAGVIQDKKGKNVWNLDNGAMSLNLQKLTVEVTKNGKKSTIAVTPTSFRTTANGPLSWEATNSKLTKEGVLTVKGAIFQGNVQCDRYVSNQIRESIKVGTGNVDIYYQKKFLGRLGALSNSHWKTAQGKALQGVGFTLGKNATFFTIFDEGTMNSYGFWDKNPILMYAKSNFDKTEGGVTKGAINIYKNVDLHNFSLNNMKFNGKAGITGTFWFHAPKDIRSNGTISRYKKDAKMTFNHGILVSAQWA